MNDNTPPKEETTHQQETGGDCQERLVVPLRDALALVDFGPCKTADRPQDWMMVASPMCAHCEGVEDVNLAAARIIAAEYRKSQAALEHVWTMHGGQMPHDDCMCDDCEYLRPVVDAIIRHNA